MRKSDPKFYYIKEHRILFYIFLYSYITIVIRLDKEIPL